MSRPAKLRNKNGYWYSEAGGVGRYFGRVGEVSHREALGRLRAALGSQVSSPRPAVPTVKALASQYLEWLKAHRSHGSYDPQSRHLRRFVERFGNRPADGITGGHVEEFRARMEKQGFAPAYVRKHLTTVRSLFRRAVRQGWLAALPFSSVEQPYVPPKLLLETDLPTPDETARLLDAAPRHLADLIRVYHATGARTGELIAARARDYQPTTRQIVLRQHKRAHTLKTPTVRTITLNDQANEIVQAIVATRKPDEHIFLQRIGKPWSTVRLGQHFAKLRAKAGVREHITIYSYRHAFMSEMLMAGVDALLVARMAGTSLREVESTYGRFRTQSYVDALERLGRFRG
jgi:integrase